MPRLTQNERAVAQLEAEKADLLRRQTTELAEFERRQADESDALHRQQADDVRVLELAIARLKMQASARKRTPRVGKVEPAA
jgi:hypothetical protein